MSESYEPLIFAELDELDRIATAAQAQWNEWPAPKRTRFIRTFTPEIALRLIWMARTRLHPVADMRIYILEAMGAAQLARMCDPDGEACGADCACLRALQAGIDSLREASDG